MRLPPFKLEEYFADWEFKARYLLCCSDIESLTMQELVDLADGESLHSWNNLSLGYTEPQGDPELRSAASEQYHSLSADDILMFAGGEEAILCAFTGMLNRGDHVVVVTPCYQSLRAIPEWLGAEVTPVALHSENNWKLDIAEVAAAIRPTTRMIVINTPHNPTGMQLTKQELEQLIALAREVGAYIFSDEVYRFSELDPTTRAPSMADLYKRGISMHVLSKSYGLPGLRIGWVATRDRATLKAIASTKHYSTICNSAPSEALALIALRAQDQLFTRAQHIVHSNYALLESFLDRHANLLRWTPPQASCTGFIELLSDTNVNTFAAALVERAGVLLLPASIYDLESNHFRIGFGRRNFPAALRIFEENLHSAYS